MSSLRNRSYYPIYKLPKKLVFSVKACQQHPLTFIIFGAQSFSQLAVSSKYNSSNLQGKELCLFYPLNEEVKSTFKHTAKCCVDKRAQRHFFLLTNVPTQKEICYVFELKKVPFFVSNLSIICSTERNTFKVIQRVTCVSFNV